MDIANFILFAMLFMLASLALDNMDDPFDE